MKKMKEWAQKYHLFASKQVRVISDLHVNTSVLLAPSGFDGLQVPQRQVSEGRGSHWQTDGCKTSAGQVLH